MPEMSGMPGYNEILGHVQVLAACRIQDIVVFQGETRTCKYVKITE
jgi:hypothetical protein